MPNNDEELSRLVEEYARKDRLTEEDRDRLRREVERLGGNLFEVRQQIEARRREIEQDRRAEALLNRRKVNLSAPRVEMFREAAAALAEKRLVFAQGHGDDRKLVAVLTRDDVASVDEALAESILTREQALMSEREEGETQAPLSFDTDRLYTVTPVMLGLSVDKAANVHKVKMVERDGATLELHLPADFPVALAKDLADSTALERLPQLRGIAHSPIIDVNTGEIMTRPGYDPRTRMWVSSMCPEIYVPEHVTEEDARAALERLFWILHTYEFAGDRNRIAAVALLITSVLRASMHVAPLFVSTAGQARTGKDHLLITASLLATGQWPQLYGLGGKVEEREKRLSQMFHAGAPFVVISNVNGSMENDDLCIFLSEGAVTVRAYGTVGTGKRAEYSAVWTASGNNLRPTGDLVTRCVVVRQESAVANPGSRVFQFEPHKELKKQEVRKDLLEAVYTIARWWILEGRWKPEHSEKLGTNNFDQWSTLVRRPLLALTGHDVFAATQEAEAEQRAESMGGVFADSLHAVLSYDWEHHRERAQARGLWRFPDGRFEFLAGAAHEAVERVKSRHAAWMRQEPNPHAPDEVRNAFDDERNAWSDLMEHVEVVAKDAASARAAGHAMKKHAGIFGESWRITRALTNDGRPKMGGASGQKSVWQLVPVNPGAAVSEPPRGPDLGTFGVQPDDPF